MKKDKIKLQEDPVDLDICTMAPEFAEHARPNEPAREPCNDGRAGGSINRYTYKGDERNGRKKRMLGHCQRKGRRTAAYHGQNVHRHV